MGVFAEYAKLYDAMYKDKDYKKEAQDIAGLLKKKRDKRK